MEIREAVVLCAGLGTRMRPLSDRVPKPCLPFLNRPLLHWTLDALAAAGVRRVLLNLHHLPQEVAACARAHGGELELRFSSEPEILGTAGVFWPVRGMLKGEAFFVVNGDLFGDLPLGPLAERLEREPACLAALAVRPLPPGAAYTPIEADGLGVLREFGRGASHFTGVYAARRELLERLPGPGFRELVRDLLRPLLPSGVVHAVDSRGRWYDLGSPSAYLAASLELLSLMAEGGFAVPRGSRLERRDGRPLLRHEGAWVSRDASVTGPAVAGEGAKVPARCQVGRCVLLPGTALAVGERLEDAVALDALRAP